MFPKPTGEASGRPRTLLARHPLIWAWLAGLLMTIAPRAQSVEDYRVQMGSLVEDRRFAEALNFGLQGLRSHPDDPALTAAVGALAIRTGQLSLGVEMVRRSVDRGVEDPSLILLVADLYLRIGEADGAVDVLLSARTRGTDAPELEHRLAEAYLMAGDEGSALAHAARAVELDPGNATIRRLCALLLDRAGREEEASRELRASLRLEPGNTGILLHLADREKRRGRPGRAVEYLEMAVAEDPENPLFHRELSGVYGTLGWSLEADRVGRAAEELEGAFEALRAAIALTAQGNLGEAVARLEAVVRRAPQFLTGAAFLADLYRKTGEDGKAEDLYRRILSRDPGRADIRSEIAWIHVGRGEVGRALDLVEASGESPESILLEAYRKQLRSDWLGAAGDLERAARLYPLDERILRQLSVSLTAAGRSEAALAFIDRASAVRPGDAAIEGESRRLRFMHARDLGKRGEWEEARRVLEALVESREQSDFLFQLGFSLQNLGRWEEAARRYRQGLRLEPGAEWARINLAFCAYHLGLYDEAARQWEILVERDREPERVHQLGLSRLRQWRLEEGWRLIAEAASAGVPEAKRMMAAAGRR